MSETGTKHPISREAMVGYSVFMGDVKVGKVDKASITAAEGCFVVSRGRVLHKLVSLPLNAIERLDDDSETVRLSISPEEFDRSPEYVDTADGVYFDKPF